MSKAIHLDTKCPHCGYHADRQGAVDDSDATPTPGDVSLCISCGEWAVYDGGLALQSPSREQSREFSRDPDLKRIRRSWEAMDAERKRPRRS